MSVLILAILMWTPSPSYVHNKSAMVYSYLTVVSLKYELEASEIKHLGGV